MADAGRTAALAVTAVGMAAVGIPAEGALAVDAPDELAADAADALAVALGLTWVGASAAEAV